MKMLPNINPNVGFTLANATKCLLRFILRRNGSTHSEPVEIKIKVPWGHIADKFEVGRHWKSQNPAPKPVLCLHGWKDNAASFDRLIPHLISSPLKGGPYEFICIDFPGHGFSSHYPPGMTYKGLDSYTWLIRVSEHFGWGKETKLNIIGHAMGAIFGFLFASTHLSRVQNLIALDGLAPVIFCHADLLRMVPEVTSHIIAMEEKLLRKQFPNYSWDEALKVMRSSHMQGMNEISCKTLMARGVIEDPIRSGHYRFTHDIRVHYLPISIMTHRQVSDFAKNLKSGVLYLKAGEGVNYMSTFMRSNMQKWMEAGNHKPVKFIEVENTPHHLHLTHPDIIANHVADFLK